VEDREIRATNRLANSLLALTIEGRLTIAQLLRNHLLLAFVSRKDWGEGSPYSFADDVFRYLASQYRFDLIKTVLIEAAKIENINEVCNDLNRIIQEY
jgi:hypothetical protein